MLRLDWKQGEPNTNLHQALPGQFGLITISPAIQLIFSQGQNKYLFSMHHLELLQRSGKSAFSCWAHKSNH